MTMTNKIDALPPGGRVVETATAVAAKAGGDRSKPVSESAASDSLRLTGDAAGLQALERELASAAAGVDLARVNQVRAALASGAYVVDPQEIARRLLALERELLG